MTLGDRIVIMKDGFIQQIGTPQEVFDHPANLFVAGFIGTPQMNFFDAKLVKDGSKYTVEVSGLKVELSEGKQKALAAKNVPSQDITLGVRPSHVALADNGISATVDVSEMMGSEVHLHANANGKDVVIIVPTVDLSGNHKETFGYGAKINFTFSGNVCHVFDKDGKNLEF
jgi:multiple sugar transport system ATP-binding protein